MKGAGVGLAVLQQKEAAGAKMPQPTRTTHLLPTAHNAWLVLHRESALWYCGECTFCFYTTFFLYIGSGIQVDTAAYVLERNGLPNF